MRNLIFLSVILFSMATAKAQVPVNPDTKLIQYQEAVNMNGPVDTLYNRGLRWVNSYFKNPAAVLTSSDEANGIITGAHRVAMNDTDKDGNVIKSLTIVEFKFKIEAKENRYRYTIDEFRMKAVSAFPLERWLDKNDPQYSLKWEGYLTQVDTHIREMIKTLKKGMEPVIVKPDNW